MAVPAIDTVDLAGGTAERFADRREAGRRLGQRVQGLREQDVVVLGLARGGVPVAAEVARALDAPLDVLVVRKLGAPGNPEYAIGALAEGGVQVVSQDVVDLLGLTAGELQALVDRTSAELDSRVARYRGGRPRIPLEGRTAVVVDDGLATGRTALAAVKAVRECGAARVVVAVPVGSGEALRALSEVADDVVCLMVPENLWAVGMWYRDFSPVEDAEVVAALAGREDTAGVRTS